MTSKLRIQRIRFFCINFFFFKLRLTEKQIEKCCDVAANIDLNNDNLIKLIKSLVILNKFELAKMKFLNRIDPTNQISYNDKKFLQDCFQLNTFSSGDE